MNVLRHTRNKYHRILRKRSLYNLMTRCTNKILDAEKEFDLKFMEKMLDEVVKHKVMGDKYKWSIQLRSDIPRMFKNNII